MANQKIDRIKASELEPFATRVMLEKILADGILRVKIYFRFHFFFTLLFKNHLDNLLSSISIKVGDCNTR